MHTISNDILEITVAEKGAEMQRIFNKQTQKEYLWSGDPAYWAKKSPVLFPIVGGLKDNKYRYKGIEYKMSRHGFARDNTFSLVESSNKHLLFLLKSNDETKNLYPFDFRFYINYAIAKNNLTITFTVKNLGADEMLFSVGAHPAFNVPIDKDLKYEDCYLKFGEQEHAGIWPLSVDGLIERQPVAYLQDQDRLQLKKELFYKDALVFKNLNSTSISIVSDKSPNGVTVSFNNFPFMGIWSAKDADFVCIEPWSGIADRVDATGDLYDKEGINRLGSNDTFELAYTIEVF